MRVELKLSGLCIDRLLRLEREWTATVSAWARDLSRLESISTAARESGRRLSEVHYVEQSHTREEWAFASRQLTRIREAMSK